MKTKKTPRLFLIPVLILSLLAPLSCSKSDDHTVNYRISGSTSVFFLRYLDEKGEIVSDTLAAVSPEDSWSYAFSAGEGDLIFVSANYKDINSALRVQVLIDGKVYKQAYSKYDTVSILTVSGTVPFSE